jgi:hypothetical protein
MAIEIVLIILLFMVIIYHSYKEFLWVKERKSLTQMFEEEKRAMKNSLDVREAAIKEKQDALVKVFMETTQKQQKEYAEAMQKASMRTVRTPVSSGILADLEAVVKEDSAMVQLLKDHPELVKEVQFGVNG